MKLKAAHWWRQDGTIVIDVRDHDAKKDMVSPSYNPYSGKSATTYRQKPQIATLVASIDLPRGTSKIDVKMAKKNLIMVHEIKVNETSR